MTILLIQHQDDESGLMPPKNIGAYDSHQFANRAMQQAFDEYKDQQNDSIMEADDSEASHFFIEFNDNSWIHWWII